MNWHPEAQRVPYDDAGPFVKAAPKIVWHTTETQGLPTYAGSTPHFTFDPRSGKLYQHVALNRAAKSLEHPSGTVETNRAHCIQVELLGYAKDTQNWTKTAYARIAKLARWIELNAGVARKCSVKFTGADVAPERLSSFSWLAYAGHCGHQHVPNNHHWDPGAFQIELVLGPGAEAADLKRKRARWARHLARLRVEAKRYGWTKPRRILGRRLKRLIGGKA